MDIKRLSRQTCRLTDPPGVVSWASVAGRLERQGPLGGSIDITDDDSFFAKRHGSRGRRRCRPWPCAAPCERAV